ncbi:tetratricopeptide repeat protein [Streptomyces sp. NPDC051954]|uniref:tetratricopeptide repeat protein n=1 Tax=Streptomyces sp. NPDC051954 TaxID=3155524 RepID=UPI00343061CC
MFRLSRDKKREQRHAAQSAAPVVAPIDVHVPGAGPGAGTASVGGVPIAAPPGEEIQHTILNQLHRIALATGHPVHATIRDERIGYVVPLQMNGDGSTRFTAEPVRVGATGGSGATGAPGSVGGSGAAGTPGLVGGSGTAGAPGSAGVSRPAWASGQAAEAEPAEGAVRGSAQGAIPPAEAVRGSEQGAVPPADAVPPPPGPPAPPPRDNSTHVLRALPEPEPEPEPQPQATRDAAPAFPLHAVPESVQDIPPGTVAPPTGEFGPPPAMDAQPLPVPDTGPVPPQDASPSGPMDAPPLPPRDVRPLPAPDAAPVPPQDAQPFRPDVPQPPLPQEPRPLPSEDPQPLLPQNRKPHPSVDVPFVPDPGLDPDPKPTPPRGFDAVAEAVLGDDPLAGAHGEGGAQLAEPVARIGEAVKAGQIESAMELAEETVAQASGTLGAEHPEVLRLRELTAYVAYLAGDPVRAFGLSLDVAGIRSQAGDIEAAYANVQSAATAWRAVRDPQQGLSLGVDLIGLWTELATEDGSVAEDIEQLESARARMGRLAERARALDS